MQQKEIEQKIHPLGSGKSVKIRFIHTDGKEHCFVSTVNSMTGSRLTWFNGDPPSIDDNPKWIKSVIKDINKKAKVLETIGSF